MTQAGQGQLSEQRRELTEKLRKFTEPRRKLTAQEIQELLELVGDGGFENENGIDMELIGSSLRMSALERLESAFCSIHPIKKRRWWWRSRG